MPAGAGGTIRGEAGMNDQILGVDGVSKRFGRHTVLDEVTFGVRAGSIHALIGENGAGKSTLMSILGGALRPDSGTVTLDGRPAAFADPSEAIRAGISTVHQEFSLFPNRTVAQNIFGHREPTGRLGFIRWGALRRQAQEILSEIGVALDPSTPVGTLSVGAQQLVEIAKALSLRARILILDEPTSALSEHEAQRLFRLLDGLKARGVGIIYISHRLSEVLQIADEISVLRDGRIAGRATREASPDDLVRMMVGRHLDGMRPPRQSSPGKEVFAVEGLTRHGAFADVSFAVREGEILGFAGLVGSGRTEVARAIFGADRLDSGRMSLDGRALTIRSPRQAIASGIGYLTEDRKALGLFLPMTVRDNIVAASMPKLVSRAGLLRPRAIRAEADRHVRRLDIRPADDQVQALTLSGGNQQKVLLAKWLGVAPRVLIVDEPTRGVDVGAKAGIHRHLCGLADAGVAIVLISSDLPEVLGLSDRVAVFRQGRLVTILDAAAATQEGVMRHASA
jgi:ABC-type sugar transport system ATPase subunit